MKITKLLASLMFLSFVLTPTIFAQEDNEGETEKTTEEISQEVSEKSQQLEETLKNAAQPDLSFSEKIKIYENCADNLIIEGISDLRKRDFITSFRSFISSVLQTSKATAEELSKIETLFDKIKKNPNITSAIRGRFFDDLRWKTVRKVAAQNDFYQYVEGMVSESFKRKLKDYRRIISSYLKDDIINENRQNLINKLGDLVVIANDKKPKDRQEVKDLLNFAMQNKFLEAQKNQIEEYINKLGETSVQVSHSETITTPEPAPVTEEPAPEPEPLPAPEITTPEPELAPAPEVQAPEVPTPEVSELEKTEEAPKDIEKSITKIKDILAFVQNNVLGRKKRKELKRECENSLNFVTSETLEEQKTTIIKGLYILVNSAINMSKEELAKVKDLFQKTHDNGFLLSQERKDIMKQWIDYLNSILTKSEERENPSYIESLLETAAQEKNYNNAFKAFKEVVETTEKKPNPAFAGKFVAVFNNIWPNKPKDKTKLNEFSGDHRWPPTYVRNEAVDWIASL